MSIGRQGIRQLGNSRRRRATRGQWYFGQKIGIPPNMQSVASTSRAAAPLIRRRVTTQGVARSTRMRTDPAPQVFNATGLDWLTDVSCVTNPVGGVYVESYPINPAEPWTFPRLSNIASQYQKYTVNSVTLMYTPTCPTSQKGTIYIAPLRNPTDPIPQTPQTMRGLSGCFSGAVREVLTVTFGKAQLSSAFNGFYCGPPKGIDPASDDVTKTCGRFALMLDGVAQADGVVGVLSLKYSFVLSDPKQSAEGSALTGSYEIDAVNSTSININDVSNIVGSPPLFPFGTLFRKRVTTPMLLLITHEETAAPDSPVVNVDGAPIASFAEDVTGTKMRSWYWILAGRQTISIGTHTNAWTNVSIAGFSTGSQFDTTNL